MGVRSAHGSRGASYLAAALLALASIAGFGSAGSRSSAAVAAASTSTSTSAGRRAGGEQLLYRAVSTLGAKARDEALGRAVAIIRKRLARLGVAPAEVERVGAAEIRVVLPDAREASPTQSGVGQTGQLYFYDWETNVIGPHGRPAATDATVTGGPEAGSASYGLFEYQAVLRAARRPPILRAEDTTLQPGCTAAQVRGCRYGSWYLLDGRHQKMLCRGGGSVCDPADTRAALYAGGYRPPAAAEARAVRVNPGTVLVQARPDELAHGRIANPSPNSFYVLDDEPLLSGSDIDSPIQSYREGRSGESTATDDESLLSGSEGKSREPIVTFGFSPHGREVFERMTKEVAQRGMNAQLPGVPKATAEQHFAIVLDGQLLTVPAVDYTRYPEGIDARYGSEIAGSFTVASARSLAAELQYGALPIELELLSRSPA
jgi:SecD/SecF fusion protein